jgi:hypothetical protein
VNEYIKNLVATAQRGLEHINSDSISADELYKTLRVIASVCNRAAEELEHRSQTVE